MQTEVGGHENQLMRALASARRASARVQPTEFLAPNAWRPGRVLALALANLKQVAVGVAEEAADLPG